jgi:hypothetical protein
MLKRMVLSAAGCLVLSGVAFAGMDVRVNVGVPVPPPVVVEQKTVVVHERETVVVKDKKDQGRHKGHFKHKKKGWKK